MTMRLQTKFYNQLLEGLYGAYSSVQPITTVVRGIGMRPGEVDLQGPAKDIWDSVLALAEQQDKLTLLLDYTSKDGVQALQNLKPLIDSGEAFLPAIPYETFIAPPDPNAIRTMLIYDLEDRDDVRLVRLHLNLIQKFTGKITLVDMHELKGGTNKKAGQLQSLGHSGILLLMLTPSFMGNPNNDCDELAFAGIQMKKRVVPVLLKPCLYTRIRLLSDIVPLPTNGTFVSRWDDKDEACVLIAEGVESLANDLLSQRSHGN